jgi:hypothetical protein
MIVSIRSLRKLVVFPVLLVALAGCGGDDEQEPAAAPKTTATAETTPPTDTELDARTETLPDDGDGTGTGNDDSLGSSHPETQTGGAGDELPAQTLALFTGRNGAITPRTVRVPAYISVRVELRSGDGAEYSLSFGDKTLQVPSTLNSVSTRFDGLKPGAKLVGTVGGGGKVVVSATAEPGP